MPRRRISTFFVPLLGIALAASAHAAVPDPVHSTVPNFVRVGGKQTSNPALPDPTLAFTVTVRDAFSNPIAGALVEISFQNCTDTHLCSFNLGAQVVDCSNRAVRGSTNAAGQVTFSILGAGTNAAPPVPPAVAPGAGAGCVRIFAEGIQLGAATAILYDQDGAVSPIRNGVTGTDLPIVLAEVNANIIESIASGTCGPGANYRGRSDFNGDGVINSADLSKFLTILAASNAGTGSGKGCSDNAGVAVPYCP